MTIHRCEIQGPRGEIVTGQIPMQCKPLTTLNGSPHKTHLSSARDSLLRNISPARRARVRSGVRQTVASQWHPLRGGSASARKKQQKGRTQWNPLLNNACSEDESPTGAAKLSPAGTSSGSVGGAHGPAGPMPPCQSDCAPPAFDATRIGCRSNFTSNVIARKPRR